MNIKKNIQNYENEQANYFFHLTEKYQQKFGLKITPGTIGHNDETDAFRHALMEAYYSLKYGGLSAKLIGDYHEKEGSDNGQPHYEKNMDLWNNAVGRETALELKKKLKGFDDYYSFDEKIDMLAIMIRDKIRKGELITDPLNDPRDFETSIHNGRIFTYEEIGQMSKKDFRYNEPDIDKQLNLKKIMTEAQAKNAVLNGNLIYIEPYTRRDGTSVCGHYRSLPE